MRRFDHRPQVGPRAERVRRLRHGHHARTFVHERRQEVRAQRSRPVERKYADFGPLAFGQHLPRHDVRVVFHLADEDVVPGSDEGIAPGVGHRVERRRGARREDDLFLRGRPTNAAIRSRAASYSSVASSERKCTPRWMLAFRSR